MPARPRGDTSCVDVAARVTNLQGRRPPTGEHRRPGRRTRRRGIGRTDTSGRTAAVVKLLGETPRRHRAKGFFTDPLDLAPVDRPVKSNADPPMPPDVRRAEEAIWLGRDELLLHAGGAAHHR